MEQTTLMEQLTTIIEKQQETALITFLQPLSVVEKKALVPLIKKMTKAYNQFGQISTNSYGYTNGSDTQRNMLQVASFVCFNRADYEKTPYSAWMLDKQNVQGIIYWYCPDWFSDFVNQQANQEFIPYYLDYEWIMELTEKGLLIPGKELIAKILPRLIFETDEKRLTHYKPENLLKRKITLEEHIWYLFEVETTIHASDRYLRFANNIAKEKTSWQAVFKQLAEEKQIDRLRLLKEALLASNRNFNKVLSGWFAGLFHLLEPGKGGLLCLQQELFSVLGAAHSKPVNTALQAIKTIVTEKDFDRDAFLEATPLLLGSATKATVAGALMILEKLARQYPASRQHICLLVTQVFIQPDSELQARAATLIEKNGDTADPVLQQEIAGYYPHMMAIAKETLKAYGASDAVPDKIPSTEEIVTYQEALPVASMGIPFPGNKEDLIFLASQAFDNNEPWHMEVLPAALVQLQAQLQEEDVPRFEPAFQRALELQKNGLRASNGYLDSLLSLFFIDFGHWLIRKFPAAGKSIATIYRKYDTLEGEKNTSWLVAPQQASYTARWSPYKKVPFYSIHQQLLLLTLDKIQKGDSLPLLSTPTYSNGYIDAKVLTDRLLAYQSAVRPINSMDIQVAIARCSLANGEAAAAYASQKLTGELRSLLLFLLQENAFPEKPFYNREAWFVASLTKKEKRPWKAFEAFPYVKNSIKNYTGELAWESGEEEYELKQYDYQAKKYVTVQARRKRLRVLKEAVNNKENRLKKFIAGLIPSAEGDSPTMLYDLLAFHANYVDNESNDIQRILSLTPGNPAPILAETLNICLNDPGPMTESDKKLVMAVLQVLHASWKHPGEMEYLFIGSCMLAADKTIANIAGEIWISSVTAGTMDSARLGTVIGRHESVEFAPLKRFTDLVGQQLLKVSSQHDRELQMLLEQVVKILPDEPVKNLKRLLELYFELVAGSMQPVNDVEIVKRLTVWNNAPSLQKLLKPWL